MKQKIYRRFRCPMFEIDINFIIGDRKDVEKFADNTNITDFTGGGCWQIEKKEEKKLIARSYLIWITDVTEFYHMVHETLHLTKMIFDLHGVPFNSGNDEMIAYYQGYWVRKFWHIMSKYVEYKSKRSKDVSKRSTRKM